VIGAIKSSIKLADGSHAGIVRVNGSEVNIKIHEPMMRNWGFTASCTNS
jgi:hypothetical protein